MAKSVNTIKYSDLIKGKFNDCLQLSTSKCTVTNQSMNKNHENSLKHHGKVVAFQ